MTLRLTLAGKTPSTTAGADPNLRVWRYTVDSDDAGEIAVGRRLALGLPVGIVVGAPANYPADTGLAEVVEGAAGSSWRYLQITITAPGPQTIAFVAGEPASPAGLTLFSALPGKTWSNVAFVVAAGDVPAAVQTIAAPAPTPEPVPESPTPATPGTPATPSPVPASPKPAVVNGRPVADFAGTLPYATEMFGVYQPLAGWLGHRNTRRIANAGAGEGAEPILRREVFMGAAARNLEDEALVALVRRVQPASQGILSPVGLVTLFRQYFFEFDTFLGMPSGHLWISPGGTVEVVESSTRRTLVDRSAEQSETTTRKAEETLTSQDDVADAVKEDNANDTKLGASASAGGQFAGMYHADASATLSVQSTTKKSSEDTHKHARTQSAKVSSEIQRNFKTTFRTVTETTDTTSRRYVIQNPTKELINYELRRKMRKVGVQVQHIGTRLSWQVFLDVPGRDLGLGELVHVVPAPDLTSIKKPEPLPPQLQKVVPFAGAFPITKVPGTKVAPNINQDFILHAHNSPEILDAGNEMHIVADVVLTSSPPAPGYTLSLVNLATAKSQGGDITFVPQQPIEVADKAKGVFHVYADRLNSGNLAPIQLTFNLVWDPPAVDPLQAQYDADMKAYDAQVADLQRSAYAAAVRDRLNLISGLRVRPSEDLRNEERQSVFGRLIRKLRLFDDPHIGSELIRQIFDVDEMLYFVAPEYWRPALTDPPATAQSSSGKYPVTKPPQAADIAVDYLAGETVVSWYSHTSKDVALDPQRKASDEWRVNYLITEDTRPAPNGSSLGWLIQTDGDERRNQFLNAAWVKAVLPIRPGHELDALEWLAQADVEGEAGLGQPYPMQPGDPPSYVGKTVGEVLVLLATELRDANTDMTNTLATEKVFESGFDPLAGGFRPAEPYEIFDQWLEVLPTDQVVAVEVEYDPKTGQQL